ncbi:hypothetical protein [Marinobacter sp.]|uniref:hypothetical protein n=1 Tax=Marinobacter sp. TaxID=50741 RepID=UPI003BAD227F
MRLIQNIALALALMISTHSRITGRGCILQVRVVALFDGEGVLVLRRNHMALPAL